MLGSLSEPHLPGSGYGVHSVVWVPWTNRSDPSDRVPRLVFEFLYSPSLHWALDSLSFRDRNYVDVPSLFEDLRNLDLLSEDLFPVFVFFRYGDHLDLHLK